MATRRPHPRRLVDHVSRGRARALPVFHALGSPCSSDPSLSSLCLPGRLSNLLPHPLPPPRWSRSPPRGLRFRPRHVFDQGRTPGWAAAALRPHAQHNHMGCSRNHGPHCRPLVHVLVTNRALFRISRLAPALEGQFVLRMHLHYWPTRGVCSQIKGPQKGVYSKIIR